jgi:hypothetical protein
VLTLGELEPSAGAGLAVFFTFYHPGIAGQVTVASKAGIVPLIYLAKSPGEAVAAGSGLTVGASAVDIDKDVEFILAHSNHQGLPYHKGVLSLRKILGQFLAVYDDLTASVPDIHPGHGGLSSSGSDTKILYHIINLLLQFN